MSDIARKRLYFFASRFFSRVVPIIAVSWRYGLLKPEVSVLSHVSGWGIILGFIFIWGTAKDLIRFVQRLGSGKGSIYVSYSKVTLGIVAVTGIVTWAYFGIEKLLFVLIAAGVSNAISIPLWAQWDMLLTPEERAVKRPSIRQSLSEIAVALQKGVK